MLRFLHTADWHLGARLCERSRWQEHSFFLQWLVRTLREENVDVLLVSGDVFDSTNPPQEAVQLYYDFLAKVIALGHITVIVTGGNHDSASHLNAPRELLQAFQIHVVGAMPDSFEKALIEVKGVLFAAIPFLRERDLRQSSAGEVESDIQRQLRQGIASLYEQVREEAQRRGKPCVAMGHLTVMGGIKVDSEREIHIGGQGAVGPDVFDGFAYAALGHLHRPQCFGKRITVRYSGSPLKLSFSEHEDVKEVVVGEIDPSGKVQFRSLPLPVWRRIERLEGSVDDLAFQLAALPQSALSDDSLTPWLEITVPMAAPDPSLDGKLRELGADYGYDVLKVVAKLPPSQQESWADVSASALSEMKVEEVFLAKLRRESIEEDGEAGQELIESFHLLVDRYDQRHEIKPTEAEAQFQPTPEDQLTLF